MSAPALADLFGAANPFSSSHAQLPPPATSALPRAARQPPSRAPRADDEDSDDERLSRRKEKKRAEEEELRILQAAAADPQSRRSRKRAAAVAIEPSEAPPQPRAAKKARESPAQPAESEADKAARTVFVGNLPAATTKKRLRQLFAGCGVVDTTRIRSATVDPEAKLPRRAALLTGTLSASRGAVNGYVVFKSAEAVEAALALNMQPLDGRHVRVDRVRAAGEGRAERGAASLLLEPRRSAYLGNLHYGVDEEEVIALFSSAGAIEAVRIPRDRDSGAAKGFAYVCFAEPGAAAALRSALALAGTELRGRPLRVARASSQRAAIAASSRQAHADARAALVAAPARRDAAAAPAKLARWKERAMRADALAAAGGGDGTPPAAPAARRAGPAPWEGVHAGTMGAAAAAGGADAAPAKPPKVRTKPRWRDQGREQGGTPLIAPSALRPDKLARLAGAGKRASTSKGAGRKQGVGKDGGQKRISGRKRPAVAQRKAAIARKKIAG